MSLDGDTFCDAILQPIEFAPIADHFGGGGQSGRRLYTDQRCARRCPGAGPAGDQGGVRNQDVITPKSTYSLH
jgi:hypothetical protein